MLLCAVVDSATCPARAAPASGGRGEEIDRGVVVAQGLRLVFKAGYF